MPALICPKCFKDVHTATRLKRISLVADKFFRKQTRELEENNFADLKKTINLEAKSDEPENPGTPDQDCEDYDDYEIIEYDTIEALEEEDIQEWPSESKDEDTSGKPLEESKPKTVPKQREPPRTYLPRRMDGNRQVHQCHCGIAFSSRHRLNNHVRVRHDVVPDNEMLPCEFCGKKFKIQEYLEHHVKNMHSENPAKNRERHPCSICGKILSSLTALRNHEDKHSLDTMTTEEVKKIGCDLCGMKFRLKCYLFNHMHNAHIRQKYICTHCSKGFYKKHEMEDHVRQHTMETPFVCEFESCGKSFHRKKNLLVHRVS